MNKLVFTFTSLFAVAGATAQGHWWVSPTGNNANAGTSAAPFQTINHAAAVAAAGDVIHLVAATYGDEQGSVVLGTKNLTLLGAGRGVTVIRSHSSLDVMLPSGTLASPAMIPQRQPVTLQGSARVNIRDLTLDANFRMPNVPDAARSLWVGTGADAVLDNVEFTNARANPINGTQGPVAVVIRGDGVGDTTNVTMRNCLVREYQKGGVVANFDAHLIMDECTVDGAGHTTIGPAQNGIQVSRGASCELRRCNVTDHWWDPPSFDSSGILLFDPGSPVVIEDCNIGNSEYGIVIFGSANAPVTGNISRNHVHAATYGFYISEMSGLTINDNSFATNRSGDNNDAWDDVGGNTWSGNHYSSRSTSGSYALPGLGAATDATAQALVSGLGANLVTNLPPGYAPIDLVTVNLDADSDVDFAALCQSATPALAIGNNSGGSFSVTGLPFGSATGAPVALVAGEFNGAPGRDLAVLTVNVPPTLVQNKVYVFANNGLGTFSLLHTHTIAGATSPSGIAAGRLNADSVDDLVVTDAGAAGLTAGKATALLNNGTGTLLTPVTLTAGYTVACRDATIGRFDGDLFADIAVIEGSAGIGRVHLFQGNGLGGFTAMAGSPISVSLNSNQVLATDVELDGDVDLLVASSRDAFGLDLGGVDVLANNGTGTFTGSLYLVDRGPTAIAAGDLDADADPDTVRPDVAVLNFAAGSISILGNWTAAGASTGGIAVAGSVASGLGIADINGDGLADLVYCDAAAGTVVTRQGVAQARADGYGAGSAGTSGLVPNLYPVGAPALPVLGNATFGLGLRNTRQFSIAVIAAGINPAPITPFGLLIADIGATWAVVNNVLGTSAVPLPIPVTPALAGIAFYCQAGIFDPNGNETAFLPGFALSNGLKIRLGY